MRLRDDGDGLVESGSGGPRGVEVDSDGFQRGDDVQGIAVREVMHEQKPDGEHERKPRAQEKIGQGAGRVFQLAEVIGKDGVSAVDPRHHDQEGDPDPMAAKKEAGEA